MQEQNQYISVEELIEIQQEETREIIDSLLEDGSDPDALYEIEHHLFAKDSAILEQAAVEAFKMGFTVLEAEEIEDEDGSALVCFDATIESHLDPQVIDEQAHKLILLAKKYDIIYDGWGTYYEGEDAIYHDDDFYEE